MAILLSESQCDSGCVVYMIRTLRYGTVASVVTDRTSNMHLTVSAAAQPAVYCFLFTTVSSINYTH